MFTHQIDTEVGLYTWLITYMQQGKRRLYPTPLVEFADLILHKGKHGIDHTNLVDTGLGFGLEGVTPLEILFRQCARGRSRTECPVRVMQAACFLYEMLCQSDMRLRDVNRLTILGLGLGLGDVNIFRGRSSKPYFTVKKKHGEQLLVGTPKLVQDHGILVRLPSGRPTKRRASPRE